jgi:hypothetical protein
MAWFACVIGYDAFIVYRTIYYVSNTKDHLPCTFLRLACWFNAASNSNLHSHLAPLLRQNIAARH